jgi:hypothetical protein
MLFFFSFSKMSIFSSICILRNHCVTVRHILQPFTAIADP